MPGGAPVHSASARETEELLRAAFDDAAVGMALVALDGRFLRVNDALCRIVGFNHDELLARTFQDITHPDDLGADLELMRRLIAGEVPRYEMEKRYVHKHGHLVSVQLNVSVVRDPAGRPLRFVSQVQDVTSRREAIQALREGEARYRVLFDANPHAAWVYDAGTLDLLAVNDAAARLYGYSRESMLRLSLRDVVHPDDLPHFAVHLRAAGASGEGRWIWRHVRKDGTAIDIETTCGALVFAGRPAGLCLNHDVTARQRADRRQAAQHTTTRALAESPTLDDAMPRILQTLCSTLQWDFGEFWAVDREKDALRCAAVHARGEPDLAAFETVARESVFPRGSGLAGRVLASGAPLWVPELSADPLAVRGRAAQDAGLRCAFGAPVALGGEVQGVMLFFSRSAEPPDDDLHRMFATIGSQIAQFIERDAADRAFRASEARTRSVIENMLEGLIVTDSQGVIASVNPSAERMFGYSRWEMVGQRIKMLMPRSLAANTEAFLKDAFPRAIGRISEWDGRRKNGEVFRFELSLYEFLTEEGRHFAGHVRDISDRRKLERLKKEFVATVSHELRTPLTSIRGSLSLLAGGALGELPDEARDVLAIAERNTVRLITLINDILDLERLEAGRMEMTIAPVPLAGIVGRSVEAVEGMAAASGVTLEVGETEVEVLGDADRLVQVLVNLLSNAVKFSPKDGRIVISARLDGRLAEVRVQDQGRGIPASHRDAIFQRFQQVEASDSRQKGGTGLGLAICRAIVEQHGGTIGVDSEMGKGSAFWFRVPVAPGFESTETARRDALLASLGDLETAGDSEDVLIADDDEALLGVLVRQLLQRGIGVRVASSVAETRRRVGERRPGLLVLDLGLPDGDGREIVRWMRTDPALKNVPLLVYTAHDLSTEEQGRLVLGPTRHLTKARGNDALFCDYVIDLLKPPEGAP
jgi:PAS domain S-box-containing protein